MGLLRIIGMIIGTLMMIILALFVSGLIHFFGVLIGILIFAFSAMTPDRGSLKLISSGIGVVLIALFFFPIFVIFGVIVMIVGAFLPSA